MLVFRNCFARTCRAFILRNFSCVVSRGGQSCRSPSVGHSRKRRPCVDWPGLLFPRGMRSSHQATSRRQCFHSITIQYTFGVLLCGRNICLGFVLRASSSRARESSAAPRCIQFSTLASWAAWTRVYVVGVNDAMLIETPTRNYFSRTNSHDDTFGTDFDFPHKHLFNYKFAESSGNLDPRV